MKPTSIACALLAGSMMFSTGAQAGSEEHSPIKVPKNFESLRMLEGAWEGTHKMGDKTQPITATYEVTSGGTAVVEKLFANTPHEMVSIYHTDGKKIGMSHYCMLGNRPEMTLQNEGEKSYAFVIDGAKGITSPTETHMHAVTLTLADSDHLKEDWVMYEKGQQSGGSITIEMTRKK